MFAHSSKIWRSGTQFPKFLNILYRKVIQIKVKKITATICCSFIWFSKEHWTLNLLALEGLGALIDTFTLFILINHNNKNCVKLNHLILLVLTIDTNGRIY